MTSEKFCLRWNDFESNISSSFRQLKDDKDFFDITLACDDEQLQAHKVILGACSPFFRKVLRRNPHQHPLLYLKGIKYTDLQSVLDFMYHGEVNIAQEELNSFLSVAEDLRVKGLTQSQPMTENSSHDSQELIHPKSKPIHLQPLKRDRFQHLGHTRPSSASRSVEDTPEIIPIKSEPSDCPPPTPSNPMPNQQTALKPSSYSLVQVDDHDQAMTIPYQEEQYEDYNQYESEQAYNDVGTDFTNKDILSQIDVQINSMMYKSQKGWHCSMCEKTSSGKINITRHIEATHINNHPGLACDLCGEFAKSRNALRMHKTKKHKVL